MRISTSQIFQQRLTALLDQQAQLSKTEMQLASGERMLSAADDPAAALQKLKLGDRLAQTQQYQKNLDTVVSRLGLEESALSGAVNLLQRIRELGVQAVNSALGPEDLKAIEVEVRENLDSLLQASNTRDANGEYIFAGYRSDTEAFSHDGLGNFTYNGDQGQRHLQVSQSRQIAVGDHGASVFLGVPDAGGGQSSVFEIVYNFAEDLAAGATDPDIMTNIDAALGRLLTSQAEVGSRQRSVADQRSINDSFSLLLEAEHSAVSDLDYTEAISRFNKQLLAFQASQQVFSKVEGMSLFDYLR
ncbi:MAG: flagellar hook-associated protein FlgL [Gammaproteobacteria bacterium]